MKRVDDQYWDKVVERLDLAVGDLAEAERKLAEVEDVPVAPREVERIVARVTGGGRGRMWWFPRVAAVVLGASMLTAGAYWLIWEGRNSSTLPNRPGTMTFAIAIEHLLQEGQPAFARQSALAMTWNAVKSGLETLREVRDDVGAHAELRETAQGRRMALLQLFKTGATSVPSFAGDPIAALLEARNRGFPVEVRMQRIVQVAEFTATGMAGLLTVKGLDEIVRLEWRNYLDLMSEELAR